MSSFYARIILAEDMSSNAGITCKSYKIIITCTIESPNFDTYKKWLKLFKKYILLKPTRNYWNLIFQIDPMLKGSVSLIFEGVKVRAKMPKLGLLTVPNNFSQVSLWQKKYEAISQIIYIQFISAKERNSNLLRWIKESHFWSNLWSK